MVSTVTRESAIAAATLGTTTAIQAGRAGNAIRTINYTGRGYEAFNAGYDLVNAGFDFNEGEYGSGTVNLITSALGFAGAFGNNFDVIPSRPQKGPFAGGGASLDKLSPDEIRRIQNAADRLQVDISVVGSRADGTATPWSDWDYVVDATRKVRHSARSSLPEGHRLGIDAPRNQDIFSGQVDLNRPHITFPPNPPKGKP